MGTKFTTLKINDAVKVTSRRLNNFEMLESIDSRCNPQSETVFRMHLDGNYIGPGSRYRDCNRANVCAHIYQCPVTR